MKSGCPKEGAQREGNTQYVDFKTENVPCRGKCSHCQNAREGLLYSLIPSSLEQFQNRG